MVVSPCLRLRHNPTSVRVLATVFPCKNVPVLGVIGEDVAHLRKAFYLLLEFTNIKNHCLRNGVMEILLPCPLFILLYVFS